MGCGGIIEGMGSSNREASGHQKGKRAQDPAQLRAACRKQLAGPRGDGVSESRRRGQGSAQVDTGIG